MIELRGVSKRFGTGHAAVENLDLGVEEGEVCALVGPSGCGKTTTMKMINRLIEPDSGTVHVGGVDVSTIDPVQLRRRIGYVIQQVGLFPHLTVAANVATVPRLLGWDRRRTAIRVDELLALVDLNPDGFRDRYPHELSGGQAQRVGVARALAADPPVLLMDEPFGALDPVGRDRLQDEFRRLQGELRKTVVFVTHDLEEAVKLGDRIAVMASGGRVEQYAPPAEVLARPASEFVASFVGEDRAIKRLGVMVLGLEHLEPAGSATGLVTVAAAVAGEDPSPCTDRRAVALGTSVRDVLGRLLLSGGALPVVDGDGRVVGSVTSTSLLDGASVPSAEPAEKG